MRLRPLRLALHVVAATALAGAGVLATGSPGSAADATRPDSFGGDSAASAFHYVADRNPQPTPVSDAFHAEVPYSTTAFDSSGNASATAASLYPGAGPLGVPALLCQFDARICTVLKTLPRYPFIAEAQYPSQPDDTASVDSGTIKQAPLEVTPASTTAHADASRVEAQTKAASAGVDGVVTAGSAVTHSKQAFEGSTLVVTAESVVSNLDLGGGQLHIDQIRSTAVARVNGGDVTTSTANPTVSGATAGGVPVTIDSGGVHVAGQGDGGAAPAAVNTALAALDASGIKVRLLAPTKSAKNGTAAAACGGLLVTFATTVNAPAVPVPNVPPVNGVYVGSVSIGGAGVTAFAAPTLDFSVPVVGGVPVAQPPALQGSGQQPAATAALSPAAPAVAPEQPGSAPVTAAAPATQPVAVLGVDLTSKRLKTLALVLLGYPVLVLLSAPLRAPARLPRLL